MNEPETALKALNAANLKVAALRHEIEHSEERLNGLKAMLEKQLAALREASERHEVAEAVEYEMGHEPED